MSPAPPGPPRGDLPAGGWLGLLFPYGGVAVAVALALPVAVLVAWWLARRRRRAGAATDAAWRSSVAEVGLVWGTVPWLWLTLLPGDDAGAAHGGVSLVPLQDLAGMATFQVVGNLLVFAAVGLLAPVRFDSLASLPRVLALAATASTLIEVTQHLLLPDRVASVDDVLLNTAGAGLAALASRRWWRTSGAG